MHRAAAATRAAKRIRPPHPYPSPPPPNSAKPTKRSRTCNSNRAKLISINQVNAANCRRAVAAGMCIDIMASDKIVFASDMTDERLDGLFAECGEAIRSTKADFWGLHLPYQTYDISSTNENTRVTAVLKLKRLIELTIEHLRPQHFVIHPGTGHDPHDRRRFRRTHGAEPQVAGRVAAPYRIVQRTARHESHSVRGELRTQPRLRRRLAARPARCRRAGKGTCLPRHGSRPHSAQRQVPSTPCATATHSTCSAASAPVWEPCTSSRTRAHSIRPIPRTSTSNPSPAD